MDKTKKWRDKSIVINFGSGFAQPNHFRQNQRTKLVGGLWGIKNRTMMVALRKFRNHHKRRRRGDTNEPCPE